MDRRQFVSTLSASAAALATGANVIASTIGPNVDDRFRGLAALIPHTSDERFHNRIRELIAAKDWARSIGIRFEWAATDSIDDNGQAWLCLKAYAGGKLVGQSGERMSAIGDSSDESRHQRDLAECEMAHCLKNDVSHSYAAGEVVCNMAGLTPDNLARLDHSHEIDEDAAWNSLYQKVPCCDETEEQFEARIHGMIAAAIWAQNVGIEFIWEPSETDDADELNRPTSKCSAYQNGKLVGVTEGWDREVMLEPIHTDNKQWAEYELALAILAEIGDQRDTYVRTGSELDDEV